MSNPQICIKTYLATLRHDTDLLTQRNTKAGTASGWKLPNHKVGGHRQPMTPRICVEMEKPSGEDGPCAGRVNRGSAAMTWAQIAKAKEPGQEWSSMLAGNEVVRWNAFSGTYPISTDNWPNMYISDLMEYALRASPLGRPKIRWKVCVHRIQ